MKPRGLDFTSWTRQQYKLSKEKWKRLPHRKVLRVVVISLVASLASVLVYYAVIPAAAELVICRLRVLSNGTASLERWERQPVPFIVKVYVWNLTNAEEVASGVSSPRFREVGPYAFEKSTVKTPLEFKEDSIVYMETTTYHHRADLTAPRSLDDIFVTLEATLYGAAVYMHNSLPSMMPMFMSAVPSLFPGADSVFVPVRVGDFLFDGIVVNCSASGPPSAKMLCASLPISAPPTLQRVPNSKDFAYSFLRHKNGTKRGPYEEKRGVEDIRQVAQLVGYRGHNTLGVWQRGSKCDMLRGTDALNFAPFVPKDSEIEIYISEICQVFPLNYEDEDSLHGLTVYRFTPQNWLKGKDENPENSCYCLKGKEQYCSGNGVRDTSNCMKAPVIISHPHFLDADPKFREYAQGCSPDRERHLSVLYIEPQTGTPVKANKRVQFNMPLMRIKGFTFAENLTEGLFPMVWIDETVTVDSETLFWPVQLPLIIIWLLAFLCLCVGSLTVKIFVCSLLSYLYLTKACCFRDMKDNRITALFHRPRGSTSDGGAAGGHTGETSADTNEHDRN